MEAMSKADAGELAGVVGSAVAGDDVAVARIVDAHQGEMVRDGQMVARDRAFAEEAGQAAWSFAWNKLGTLKVPDRRRPCNWPPPPSH